MGITGSKKKDDDQYPSRQEYDLLLPYESDSMGIDFINQLIVQSHYYENSDTEQPLFERDTISQKILPVIEQTHRVPGGRLINQYPTVDQFIHQFNNLYPMLANLPIDGYVLTGPLIRDLFCGWNQLNHKQIDSSEYPDVEIMLHSMAEFRANSVRDALINHLIKMFNQLKLRFGVVSTKQETNIYYWNQGSDFLYPICIRIPHKIFPCLNDCLYRTDLGSDGIGFNGHNLFWSRMGKFSYTYLVNILDTTRMGANYGNRLYDAIQTGFGTLIPWINVDKLFNPKYDGSMRDPEPVLNADCGKISIENIDLDTKTGDTVRTEPKFPFTKRFPGRPDIIINTGVQKLHTRMRIPFWCEQMISGITHPLQTRVLLHPDTVSLLIGTLAGYAIDCRFKEWSVKQLVAIYGHQTGSQIVEGFSSRHIERESFICELAQQPLEAAQLTSTQLKATQGYETLID